MKTPLPPALAAPVSLEEVIEFVSILKSLPPTQRELVWKILNNAEASRDEFAPLEKISKPNTPLH